MERRKKDIQHYSSFQNMTIQKCKKCDGQGTVENPIDDMIIPCIVCRGDGIIDTEFQKMIMLLRDMQKEVIPDAIEFLRKRDYDCFMLEMRKIGIRHKDITDEITMKRYGELGGGCGW